MIRLSFFGLEHLTGDSNIIMDFHIFILGLVTAALKGKNNMKSGKDSSEYTIYTLLSAFY